MLWADINEQFGGGWPPSELDQMPITELLLWHAEAVRRNQAQQAALKPH